MDIRGFGFDPRLLDFFLDHMDSYDESHAKSHHTLSWAYVRDSKAMANTHADILDYPNAYKFVVDMPGLRSDQVRVHVEDHTLVVCGERKRDKEKDQKESVKYIRMEKRLGKFLKRFELLENADSDKICANYQDGVLIVCVEKKLPPQQSSPRPLGFKLTPPNPKEDMNALIIKPSQATGGFCWLC